MVEVRFINDTTPIEVTSDEQETQIGVVSENQATEIQVGGLAHADLSGRDLPDQHPIGAITGLQDTLDTIPTDYVSDAELEAALLEKQDVIRDLSEIRQGATLGATAVQPSDLESYATKDYVDNGLAEKQDTLTAGTGIDITNGVISNTQTSAIWGNITGTLSAQTDLQNALNAKANTADIPTATSDLTNDSGFITLSALTPYATQTWVSQQGYLTEIPAEYVTDSELTAKGYQTAADVETAITAKGYTTMSAVEAKGYITNAALVGYATESYVTTALSTGLSGKQDTISDLATIRSGASAGATAVQPSDLATVATSGSYTDLINKPTNVSAFTNDAGYITNSALTGYATQTWVGQQGFITGITSSDVTTALGYTPYNSSNPSGYITSAALNGYATESYVTTATANMQTTGNLVTSISSTSTNAQYPSAKCVYDIVGDVETLINAL